jgi:hypothetical protein
MRVRVYGKRFTGAVACLAFAGLAGCRDDMAPTASVTSAASQQASATGAAHGMGRGLEDEGPLGRFAASNLDFGGWFFDKKGDLNVWVLDPPSRGARVRAAVAQTMAQEPRDITEKASYQIKILPARYSFVQLSGWRDSLDTRFDRFRGMRWTDVDDVRNRVSVSVDSRRTRAQLRNEARELGIPSGSLNVMVASGTWSPDHCTPEMLDCNADPCLADPFAPGCDACSSDPHATGCDDPCSIDPNASECVNDPCAIDPNDPACGPSNEISPDPVWEGVSPVLQEVPGTLQGRFEQLQGGIQITYEDIDRGPLPCTLGFVANSQSRGMVVVTNAHCSASLGSTDGTIYGQPTSANTQFGSDWFGREVYDPPLTRSWACLLFGCRNSDANFVSTSFSGGSSSFGRNYAFGKIARPIGPKTSINDTTTRINPSAPQLTIVGETRPSVVGRHVHKIGRTTGWTQGTLTYYCRKERGYFCQDGANYVYRSGDSGSPVFQLYANGTVGLIGIHHSKLSVWSFNQSIYSPLSQIRKDLGAFQTFPGGPS